MTPVQVRLETDQIKALREVAFRRAQERGAGRIDVSELVREAVAEWLTRHAR